MKKFSLDIVEDMMMIIMNMMIVENDMLDQDLDHIAEVEGEKLLNFKLIHKNS